MKTSSIQLSLKHLRKMGWTACVVEKWVPPRGDMEFGRRIDAFGFGDILACRKWTAPPEHRQHPYELGQIALVQTSALTERQRHKDKTNGILEFRAWKAAGGIVLLHSWRKVGARGKRKTWQVIEERL